MGIVMALYVTSIVSFCFPHVVDLSVLSICVDLRDFVILSMFLLYVSLGSRVSHNICGLMFMGSVVFSELRIRLFVCVHVCIS